MTIENPPVEDVFTIEHGDFPASHMLVFGGEKMVENVTSNGKIER